ncbi:hypothetical protein QMK33_13345 [Hymenobacter sp. H14-R3]|uniref:hypothetical protein n=1 Tax=Hymenobacter sp. H14-R3 TaxID=3046308 RepID=UPI0024BAB895|nr:hypothetical protein [Hymenobacter sp. H14-R3]MDJ0366140.1 hypothetical protein [Hymenobacter sp. H14-R3]
MANYFPGAGRPLWQRWLPGGLLLALLLLGASLYRGYGLTWDEPNNHYNGVVNLNYAAEFLLPPAVVQRLTPPGVPLHPKSTWQGFDHGVAFELPAALLGRLLYPGNAPEYYRLRHLLVFLVFVAGVAALYRLARLRYPAARWLPLLAAAALVASPRFFAEAFYNGKDIVFMAAFTLAMLTLVRLAQRPTWPRALAHAAATALAADVRFTGLVLLTAFTAAALLLQAYAPLATPTPARRRLALFGLFALVAAALTLVGWPYLWADPATRLLYVMGHTTHFPWPGLVFYIGKLVAANALPWHYLPVWMLITIPLPYSALGALGLGTALRTLARHGRAALRRPGAWLDTLLLAWLLGPLAAVMVVQAVVYDGWRHLYFVYPALLLLALRGARALGQAWQQRAAWRWVAGTVMLLLVLETGRTVWFMVRAYPNQQVYFSFLSTPAAERLFERDYWGGSVLFGLEWLLRHDASPVITVSGPLPLVLYNSWLMLSPAQQSRLHILVDERQARYFLTFYREHPPTSAAGLGPEVLAYRPGGRVKTLSIFRRDSLRRPLPLPPSGFLKREQK